MSIVDELRTKCTWCEPCDACVILMEQAAQEIEGLRETVCEMPDLLMAIHDVMLDILAMRQGRPSAFVGSDRLEYLTEQCREAAEKSRKA